MRNNIILCGIFIKNISKKNSIIFFFCVFALYLTRCVRGAKRVALMTWQQEVLYLTLFSLLQHVYIPSWLFFIRF